MSVVKNLLDPESLVKALDAIRLPRRTLAALADMRESTISLFLSGRRVLSLETQLKIFDILKFCQNLQRTAPVPVDFRERRKIQKLFEAHQREQVEADAFRQSSEFGLEVAE